MRPFSYWRPVVREVPVDVLAVVRVRVEALLALGLRALARRADVHHQRGALDLLGERERARVQRVGELLVVLGDDAGAAARRAVELDELEVQHRRDLGHRAVELGREAAADAAGPVGDLHRVGDSSGSWPGWPASAPGMPAAVPAEAGAVSAPSASSS